MPIRPAMTALQHLPFALLRPQFGPRPLQQGAAAPSTTAASRAAGTRGGW